MPELEAVVDRRLLVNYRVDPDVIARILPDPLRPHLVDGAAVAGICLLRLTRVRPRGLPAAVGLRSENAAHRIAVVWDTPDGPRHGVFIPRRDTASVLNVAVGGRLFPGVHHRARFRVSETPRTLSVAYRSIDGLVDVAVRAHLTDELTGSTLFAGTAQASEFFRCGSAGYSVTTDPHLLDGLELRTDGWRIDPCHIESAESSYYDDRARFPAGSIELDCALVMRRIPAHWLPLPSMPIGPAPVGASPADRLTG
jgi:hypothetical protein